MSKKIISSPDAPQAVGPYSQGVEAKGILFLAGQIPLDPAGNIVPGGITEQTDRVLKNIQALLKAAGYSVDDVVKSTVFLSDMNNFAGMNAEYAKVYTKNPPARSTVQVARLPKDALVEIETIAIKA